MASLAISQTPTAQAGTGPGAAKAATPAEAFLALIDRFMSGGEAPPADPALPAGDRAGDGEAVAEEDTARKEEATPAPLVAGLFLAGLPADPAPPAGTAIGTATDSQEAVLDAAPQVPEGTDPSALLPAPDDPAETPLLAGNPDDAAAGEDGAEADLMDGTADAAAALAAVLSAKPKAADATKAGATDAGAAAGHAAKPADAPALPAAAPDADPSALAGPATPDAGTARPAAEAQATGETGDADAASAPADTPPTRTDATRTGSGADAGRQDARDDGRGNRDGQEGRAPAHHTADGADGSRPAGPDDMQGARAPGTASAAPGGAQPPAAADAGKPAVSFAQALDAAQQPADPAALPGGNTGTLSLRPAGDAASALPGGQPGHAGQPHPASEMVSVHFARMADTKADHMRIQLRPVELGAVEVKLDFGKDGTVHASVVADRPETLDLLQKDARSLEKALNDAGFRTGNEGLSFNLRGDQGGGERNFAGFRQAFGRQNGRSAGTVDGLDPATARQMTFLAGPGTAAGSDRIDIRI